MTQPRRFSLDDKYLCEEGTIYLNGIQALVRLALDQHRADARRGLKTATFISGYRGSPLGGLDTALERAAHLLRDHDVVFSNGLNEELAATAIFGSQVASLHPGAKYDGVLGMWYGKGPGVDRSGDIFKHANLAGVARNGGVLALGGDDPIAKSSTIPSHSEPAFFDAGFPILYPGNAQELLDLGLYGFALSRYAGLWVGVKCVTNVCDEAGTAEVSPERVRPITPEFSVNGQPFHPGFTAHLLPPQTLEREASLHGARLAAARRYSVANGLNRIVARGPHDRLGIIAAGKTYFDVEQSLRDMGLTGSELARAGIRLLKLAMVFPVDAGVVREFARGLEEVLIIEEKRAFLELFARDALYSLAERPVVVGKSDEEDKPLVPPHGELDAETITQVIARRLARRPLPEPVRARVEWLEALERRPKPVELERTPYFCSGCPHNTSTRVPAGSVAGGGIGCHAMATMMDRSTSGLTPMGAEGAQWIGMAPFTETTHMFQNLGDGTLFHSGILAIKACVFAGVNITYKILYNAAVAMTGGQTPAGMVPVEDLTRQLEAEGVRAISVVSDAPRRVRRARLAKIATVHHRSELDAVQRRLRAIPGTTVLLYDQQCAAEQRRLRKRGKRPDPPRRVFINEAVCEGCGDCGAKSNCLSVQPVETALGRKTRIHQSSCNKDYSCLEGDCPSFVTAVPRRRARRPKPARPAALAAPGIPQAPGERSVPEPRRRVDAQRGYVIYMTGIGGTGVVTVNALLGTAALLEGKKVRSLDQTGMSQKGGPVVSSLKLFDGEAGEAPPVANRVGAGEADLYLGFDLLVSAHPSNLARAHPERTRAVVSTSQVPTGQMVARPEVSFPRLSGLIQSIERHTRRSDNIYLDAQELAEVLFEDHMPANVIVLGAAYQAGLLPLAASSIEKAIELNGVAAAENREAFRWGRLWVADRLAVEAAFRRRREATRTRAKRGETAAASPRSAAACDQLVAAAGFAKELGNLVGRRFVELVAYQNIAYARRYADFVTKVARQETSRVPGRGLLAETVARQLFTLMAYKDEYEVARLLLRDEPSEEIARWFPDGARVYYHLHPPLLRALGLKRKLRLGRWWLRPLLRLLYAFRRIRGSWVDPFARMKVRRVERGLVGEYQGLVDKALERLGPQTYDTALAIAELPDLVRGYEEIKLEGVTRFRDQAAKLVAALEAPPVAAAASGARSSAW